MQNNEHIIDRLESLFYKKKSNNTRLSPNRQLKPVTEKANKWLQLSFIEKHGKEVLSRPLVQTESKTCIVCGNEFNRKRRPLTEIQKSHGSKKPRLETTDHYKKRTTCNNECLNKLRSIKQKEKIKNLPPEQKIKVLLAIKHSR